MAFQHWLDSQHIRLSHWISLILPLPCLKPLLQPHGETTLQMPPRTALTAHRRSQRNLRVEY